MSSDNAVGIMDGAYFTSRSEILEFINNLLDLNLTKIEQTASGAVACQICEYMFPGSVQMRRVNWETKNSYEYVQNYKLLQAAFTKNRVQKYVDVDKLIRGKYQDNLEFCQWLKAFFDQQGGYTRGDEYDPVSVRAKGKGGKMAREHLTGTASAAKKSGSGHVGNSRAPVPRKNSSRTAANKTKATAQPSKKISPREESDRVKNANNGKALPIKTKPQKENLPHPTHNKNNNNNDAVLADAALISENKELSSRNAELELLVNEIEKERDFYFDKLRSVEVLVQVHEENKKKFPSNKVESSVYEDLLSRVLKVLYATTEEEVVIDDEGNLVRSVVEKGEVMTEKDIVDEDIDALEEY